MSWWARLCFLLIAIGFYPTSLPASAPLLPFELQFNGLTSAYKVIAVSLMPQETLVISVPGAAGRDVFELKSWEQNDGPSKPPWKLRAPSKPALYPLRIRHLASGEEALLQVFVMRPLVDLVDGQLNGYLVGEYPKQPLRGQAIYRPPKGMIEMTPELADVPVSPHYTLGQFPSKQQSAWPRYLILRTRLLLKLEFLTAEAQRAELLQGHFSIMSGFRTPAYNAAIGNRRYSRHLWGGAADIFIDEAPRDGLMDDLNRDGKHDRGDAEMLARFVEQLSRQPGWSPFVGGLGIYGPNNVHAGFIHVDVRGFAARW